MTVLPGSVACGLCSEQRDILTVFGEDVDPEMGLVIAAWHDRFHPEPGPFLAAPGAWPNDRGPGTADRLDMAEFTVGPKEVLCTTCWLVHRPGRCDR